MGRCFLLTFPFIEQITWPFKHLALPSCGALPDVMPLPNTAIDNRS
jgi:hypothetical protein